MERASHHHWRAQPPWVEQASGRSLGSVPLKEVSLAVTPVAVEA